MLGRIASFVLAFAVTATSATSSTAQEREFLGFGWLLTNDLIGDGKDRWRTGSIATSRVWGRGWNGALPENFGDIIEFRFGGEIIAPRKLNDSGPGDRPYAGAMSWGLHTHVQRGATSISTGADLVAIGPMTGLDDFQSWLHDLVGIPGPSASVRAAQIANQWLPRAVIEIGRDIDLGPGSRLRPFVEGRAGDETLLRAGFDFTFGGFGSGDLLVRDWVTGQRFRAVGGQEPGVSFMAGADVAKVFDSVYLPSSRGFQTTDMRSRVRAGLHWQGEKSSMFYGLTWLGEEFAGQSEGQLVGAVTLSLRF